MVLIKAIEIKEICFKIKKKYNHLSTKYIEKENFQIRITDVLNGSFDIEEERSNSV